MARPPPLSSGFEEHGTRYICCMTDVGNRMGVQSALALFLCLYYFLLCIENETHQPFGNKEIIALVSCSAIKPLPFFILPCKAVPGCS